MIRFKCPHCGKAIKVKDEGAGKKGKCHGCGEVIRVPVGPTPEEPEAQQAKPAQHSQQSEKAVTPSPPPRQHTPVPIQAVDMQPVSDHQPFPVLQTPATAIQVNVQQPSRAAHSLGISSLVLGIFSFLIFWIPFISIPLSSLGILLGIIGLILAIVRKGTGIGYSIAGAAVSSLALAVGVILTMLFTQAMNAVDTAMNEMAEEMETNQAQPVELTPQSSDNDKDTPTETAPQKETGPVWTKADTPLELGNIQLRITGAVIGKVPLSRRIVKQDGESEDKLLTIWVEISNISENKKVDYKGWMSTYASLVDIDAELTDNHGNSYRGIDFSSLLSVKDAETTTSIYPGKSIKDAIVFQLPIEGIEYLRLKLSAKGCEEEGEFRFEIPNAMIK